MVKNYLISDATVICNHVPPRGVGDREAKVPWFYLRGVPVVQWICQAFDSRQTSGGNSGAFYRDIVRFFDGIFTGF